MATCSQGYSPQCILHNLRSAPTVGFLGIPRPRLGSRLRLRFVCSARRSNDPAGACRRVESPLLPIVSTRKQETALKACGTTSASWSRRSQAAAGSDCLTVIGAQVRPPAIRVIPQCILHHLRSAPTVGYLGNPRPRLGSRLRLRIVCSARRSNDPAGACRRVESPSFPSSSPSKSSSIEGGAAVSHSLRTTQRRAS